VNQSLTATPVHQSTRISEYAARNPGTIDLTVGLPSYGPPAIIRAALREALDRGGDEATAHDRYAPVRGVAALREAIADLYARTSRMSIDPSSEIVVTHGAAGGLWLAVLTATDPADEVLLLDPCYMLYEPIVTVLGRVAVRVPTAGDNGFSPDPDTVRSRVSPRTRLMVLNSPANPTGTVLEAPLLVELAVGARIAYDEVLDAFSYAAPHSRLHMLAPDVSITINSLSKRFGMAGWRIGWMIADPAFIAEAAKAQTFNTLSVSHIVQQASAVGLADRSTDAEVAGHAETIRRQGERFLADLESVPLIEPPRVAGGFYAFVNVGRLARHLDPLWDPGSGAPAGQIVADALLATVQVAVVPGPAFGAYGRDYIRISFPGPVDRLDEAVRRLRIAAGQGTQAQERAPCG
jgi:aspartate/methionine/tyrosine aminotransferase